MIHKSYESFETISESLWCRAFLMNLSDEASTVSKNGRCSIEFNRMIILTVRIFNSAVILNESKSFELQNFSKHFKVFWSSKLLLEWLYPVTVRNRRGKCRWNCTGEMHRRENAERAASGPLPAILQVKKPIFWTVGTERQEFLQLATKRARESERQTSSGIVSVRSAQMRFAEDAAARRFY